jgi:hypothetical protein
LEEIGVDGPAALDTMNRGHVAYRWRERPMEPGWVTHESPGDYTLEHPAGWSVITEKSPLLAVMSPDFQQLAIFEPLGMVLGRGTPAEILRAGRFTATEFFHDAAPGPVVEAGGSASCLVGFSLTDGTRMRARVTCKPGRWCHTIFAVAAPEGMFAQAEPSLVRILDSFRTPGTDERLSLHDMQCAIGTGRPGANPSWKLRPAGPLGPPAPAAAAGPAFVPFTDPTVGGFHLEVPRGWQVRGGLHHPALGDRRWYVEARSPDGIDVLIGDPDCPQDFCHNLMVWGEVMVPYPQGVSFLNLRAQAKRLAGYYLKNVLPRRTGPLKITSERDRKDTAAEETNRLRQLGLATPRSFTMSAHEARFEAGSRAGCCYATSWYDSAQMGRWMMGMTVWSGSLSTWLAPAGSAAVAETVLAHMRESFRVTPRMLEVTQRDEAIVTANGMTAAMRQQAWFEAQQAIHRTQVAQGDAIVDGYWDTQRVYDRLSQQRSDAMLDRQRLSDEGMGRTYDAASGYKSYWLDQQTGQIFGTDTDDPPDNSRNYTPLRKL